MKKTPAHTAHRFAGRMMREVTTALASGEWKSYDMRELIEVFGSRENADWEAWHIAFITGSELQTMVGDDLEWVIFTPSERIGTNWWN